jgi:DNA mismatch endonuclease (patch repair protein)
MTDIFTKEKRSELMRKVKNKNTNIEIILRKGLFKRGYRFRIKNSVFGKPDIIFPSPKIAIFCDGDFWHGKNYKKDVKNYKTFWKEKILVNMKRDKKVNKKLKLEGWKVLRFWRTEILKDPDKCLNKIEKSL